MIWSCSLSTGSDMMNWCSLVIYIRYIHLFHGGFFTPFTLGKSFRAVCSEAGEISEYLGKKVWPNASPVRELRSWACVSAVIDRMFGGSDPTNWGVGFQPLPFWVTTWLFLQLLPMPLPWQHPHLILLFRDVHHLMSCSSGTI